MPRSTTILKRSNAEMTTSSDSKEEKPTGKRIKMAARRSRLITEDGIAQESQVSQISATPESQEELPLAERPIKVRTKPARIRRRPSFFPESKNTPVKIEIRKLTRQPVDDHTATKTEFLATLEIMLEKIFKNTMRPDRKIFIGKLLHLMVKAYRDGDTFPEVIKAENDGALVRDTEMVAKKMIYIFLANAVAYGYNARDELAQFRKSNLQSYEYVRIQRFPDAYLPKIDELNTLLPGKKYDELSPRAQGLLDQVNNYIDTTLQESAMKNDGTENYFKLLLTTHVERIAKYFPNTASSHIVLFGVRIATLISNPNGSPLPSQIPPVDSDVLFAKAAIAPFMVMAARLKHDFSEKWVARNGESGTGTRARLRSTIS
jgi:hypothetical protein